MIVRQWITISSAIGVLFYFLPPSTLQARTWQVPLDAPTIQAGIDSASVGDEVVVACDTYYEHDIELKSGVTLLSATGQSDCTIIDAQGMGRVFICVGVDETAGIIGFTLTGGLAAGVYPGYLGGGIYCENASPTISRCQIQGNAADYGGGLYCNDNSMPLLDHCLFGNNSSLTMGGGVYCHGSSPALEFCTISDNRADSGGDGMYCANVSRPALAHCTIHGNDGDGLLLYDDSGPTLDNCLIAFNGGQACACDVSSVPTLECCDLFGNLGDWVGLIAAQENLATNISVDPVFCADEPADEQDWSLSSNSPCVAPQTPCDLIGAWGADCTVDVATDMTWGGIKALYR